DTGVIVRGVRLVHLPKECPVLSVEEAGRIAKGSCDSAVHPVLVHAYGRWLFGRGASKRSCAVVSRMPVPWTSTRTRASGERREIVHQRPPLRTAEGG